MTPRRSPSVLSMAEIVEGRPKPAASIRPEATRRSYAERMAKHKFRIGDLVEAQRSIAVNAPHGPLRSCHLVAIVPRRNWIQPTRFASMPGGITSSTA
jgi:hypothetical protein